MLDAGLIVMVSFISPFKSERKMARELVEKNEFREDLLFRLNVFPIDVPSLTDRSDDIPEIIEHFIARKKTKNETKNKEKGHNEKYE